MSLLKREQLTLKNTSLHCQRSFLSFSMEGATKTFEELRAEKSRLPSVIFQRIKAIVEEVALITGQPKVGLMHGVIEAFWDEYEKSQQSTLQAEQAARDFLKKTTEINRELIMNISTVRQVAG